MNQTNTVSNPIASQVYAAIQALDPESDHFEVNMAGISRSISELTNGEVQAQLSAAFEERRKVLGVQLT